MPIRGRVDHINMVAPTNALCPQRRPSSRQRSTQTVLRTQRPIAVSSFLLVRPCTRMFARHSSGGAGSEVSAGCRSCVVCVCSSVQHRCLTEGLGQTLEEPSGSCVLILSRLKIGKVGTIVIACASATGLEFI